MYVTNHAVQRFKERVLHDYDPLTDNGIKDLILNACLRKPLKRMVTLKNFGSTQTIEKFFYEAVYRGDPFYAMTDMYGEAIITVIDAASAAKWTIYELDTWVAVPQSQEVIMPMAVGGVAQRQENSMSRNQPILFIPKTSGTTPVSPSVPAPKQERSPAVSPQQPTPQQPAAPAKQSMILQLLADIKTHESTIKDLQERLELAQMELDESNQQRDEARSEVQRLKDTYEAFTPEEMEALRAAGRLPSAG